MNTFRVVKFANGTVAVKVTNQDQTAERDLNAEEANALNGLLNESEFEQHISQQPIITNTPPSPCPEKPKTVTWKSTTGATIKSALNSI